MNRITNISPFAFGILIVLIIGLNILVPLDQVITEKHFTAFQVEYLILSIKMAALLGLALLAITNLKLMALSGLSADNKWSFKYLNIIPVYLFMIGITTFWDKDLSHINSSNLLLLFFSCLVVGFAEEFIFRSALQPIFIRKYIAHKNGVFLAVLFQSLFFGLMHLYNLRISENLPQVVGQVIYAIFIGFFFGALLLKTNKIIPIAITHGLINFFFSVNQLPGIKAVEDEMVNNDFTAAIGLVLINFPLFIIAVFILKRIRKEDVAQKLHNN